MDYSTILSKRACSLQPSGIRKFFDMLENMKDVVALTVGQPDFITPWHIREAGIRSLEEGRTYYTSNSGLMELRTELSKYASRRFGLEYDPKDEILVTVGGSEAIDLALRAIVDLGDEVIVPQPSFVCYDPLVTMAGGVPVILPLKKENGFVLTPEELEEYITPKTKALVLPFPNNPTGSIMTKEQLLAIAPVIIKHNLVVISDEIYAELTYGRKHVSVASLEGMRDALSLLDLCMASNGEINLDVVKTASGIGGDNSCENLVEAVKNGDGDIEYMRDEYNGRRRLIVNGLREAGIDCMMPDGAFYVFADISRFGMTSEEFCEKLLAEKGVAIVPGTAFGASGEGYARISYAYSATHIKKAILRITEFVKDLSK